MSTFSIGTSVDGYGSISPSSWTGSSGQSAVFTITPNPGYVCSRMIIDGVFGYPGGSSWTFTDIQANHYISVIFVPLVLNVSAIAGAGGSINPAGLVQCGYNQLQRFQITPNANYSIEDVVVNGDSKGAVSFYTFSSSAEYAAFKYNDHTIQASFVALNSQIITATATGNGSISPSGSVACVMGENKTFVITPDSGYSITDVLVDGVSVGAVALYTFYDITTNHTIEAIFSITQVIVLVEFGVNGRVIPSGEVSVGLGTNSSFSIIPDAGYQINGVYVDGINITIPSNGKILFTD